MRKSMSTFADSISITGTMEATDRRRRILLHHKLAVLIVFAFTMGGSLYFYTFTTYMQKYLVNTAHMDARIVSVIMTAVLIAICAFSRDLGRFPIGLVAAIT